MSRRDDVTLGVMIGAAVVMIALALLSMVDMDDSKTNQPTTVTTQLEE